MSDLTRCERCGERLTGKVRWLELDMRTNTYHDLGNVPADKSQGAFPFGTMCARNALAEHEAKILEK